MFLVLDKEGNILRANTAFTAFFGSINQDGKRISLFEQPFWKGNISELQASFDCLNKGVSGNFFQTLKGLQTSKCFEVEVRSMDEDRILVEFKDCEELEESKISEAKARLEASEQRRSVEELAAVISHDLRAPVANMAYLMSLFNKKDLSKEEFIPFIEALQASTHRTLEAIDGLGHKLNFDLKERGAENLPIQLLIDSVLQQYKDEIEEANALVHISAKDCRMVNVHKGAFRMILGQLLSNSLKFRNPQQRLEVEIVCTLEGESCKVEVKDNGLGIDLTENGDRIFGLFQTFHNHPDARGIGLYQVKNRLRSIGGEIRLDSKKGLGTTVTLNFKANVLEEAPVHY